MSKLFEQLRKAADARAKAGPARPVPVLHDLEMPVDLGLAKERASTDAAVEIAVWKPQTDVAIALAKQRAFADDTARQVAAWQAQSDIAVAHAKKLVAEEALAAAHAATGRQRAEDEARKALEMRLEADRQVEAALLQRIEAERRAEEATNARLEVERLADEQAQRVAELERRVRNEPPETESSAALPEAEFADAPERQSSFRFAKAVALVTMLVLVALAWTYTPWRAGAEGSKKPSPALKIDPRLGTK